MQEARESLNVRFTLDGFDCQYTTRTDQEVNDLLSRFLRDLDELRQHGAVPTGRQPNNSNPSSQPPPDIDGKPAPTEAPDCKTCGNNTHMELLTFRRNGEDRSAWKCQECHNWHYPKDDKKATAKKGAPK